jgi:hypothetical protein
VKELSRANGALQVRFNCDPVGLAAKFVTAATLSVGVI